MASDQSGAAGSGVARGDLADKFGLFSDSDLDSCYDDVVLALVTSRCLSVHELDQLTDAIARAGDRRRAATEAQLHMLLDRVRTIADEECTWEPPAPGCSNAACGIPQTGLTRTGCVDIRLGDCITLKELESRPALNGLSGIVVAPGYSSPSGRVAVRVCERDGTELGLSVRPRNLILTLYAHDETGASLVPLGGWPLETQSRD